MKEIIISFLIVICFSPLNTFGECIKGDCINGQGTISLPNGKKYVGEWQDGKRHGQGTMTYPNGIKYLGQFKDGKLFVR